jgi:hypothetical protein
VNARDVQCGRALDAVVTPFSTALTVERRGLSATRSRDDFLNEDPVVKNVQIPHHGTSGTATVSARAKNSVSNA